MSTAEAAWTRDTSPRTVARIAGALFLLTILTGGLAQGLVSERLIDPTNAAATARSILGHPSLCHFGFAMYLVEMACQVAMTAVFYHLLRPVGRNLSLLAALMGLTGCVIKTFSRVFFVVPLLVLRDPHTLGAFDEAQRQALAMLLFDVNDRGAAMALVFFGIASVVKGYLIHRSTFLPRVLGVLGMICGLGWLTFLVPPVGYRLLFYVVPIGVLGALVQIGWLLVRGVDEVRWKEQAERASASLWR